MFIKYFDIYYFSGLLRKVLFLFIDKKIGLDELININWDLN